MRTNKTKQMKSRQTDQLLPLPPAPRRAVAAKAATAQVAGAYGGPTGPNFEVDCGVASLLQSTYVSPAGISLGLLAVGKAFHDVACSLDSADPNKTLLADAATHMFALSARKATRVK